VRVEKARAEIDRHLAAPLRIDRAEAHRGQPVERILELGDDAREVVLVSVGQRQGLDAAAGFGRAARHVPRHDIGAGDTVHVFVVVRQHAR
jgi:hypothetical protein